MTKRALRILLLAALLALTALTAARADVLVTDTTGLQGAIDGATAPTTILVQNSFDLTKGITINSAKNITIKGAADGITITRANRTGAMFALSDGSTLTLEGITIDGAKSISASRAIITCEGDGTTLNLGTGATLQNNNNTSSSNMGGGVCMNAGTLLHMTGGAIKGNASSGGGGIYASGATIILSGDAAIESNTASSSGGGIAVNLDSCLTMSGNVVIQDNNAKSGGGIFSRGEVAITNCAIRGNQAATGGGISINSAQAMTIDGCLMRGNIASGDGGAIYSLGPVTLMGDTQIVDNAANKGGGVCFLGAKAFDMWGGASITNNKASTNGGGVYIEYLAGGACNWGGAAVIQGNTVGTAQDNVYLASGNYITLGAFLPESGMRVGVHTATASGIFVNASATESMLPCFFPDKTDYIVVCENAQLKLVPSYTITYDANGGANPPSPQTARNTDSADIAQATGMTHPSLVFDRWNTQPDGSGTDYRPGATYTDKTSVTLYAIWRDLAPSITVSAYGLDQLQVGVTVSGAKIVYALRDGTYAASITDDDFTGITGLPEGLAVGAVTRTDTTVEVAITGAPAKASQAPTPLGYPQSIPAHNMLDGTAPITPTGTIQVGAVAMGTYVYYDPTSHTNESHEATALDAASTAWGQAGQETWYVCQGDVAIPTRVQVRGAVNLILADGCNLTASAGIQVQGTDSLTIWGQQADSAYASDATRGKLTAKGADGDPTTGGHAGIGGNYAYATGAITINGGDITATGGYVTGSPTITANTGGAGIGDGGSNGFKSDRGGTITINAGKILATGGKTRYGGAGIGGGGNNCEGTIVINGGTIDALGTGDTYGGTGIGAGAYSNEWAVTIAGGSIGAQGGPDAAGIGGAFDACGTIAISGGTIRATGGYRGAGIGSGAHCSKGGSITIWGHPTIIAQGGGSGAGIGSGSFLATKPLIIHIAGGSIAATGGSNGGSGIGSGYGASKNIDITLTGGNTTATAGTGNSVGIGSSGMIASGGVTINIQEGAAVKAVNAEGAAIGAYLGNASNPTAIIIAGGTIETISGPSMPNIGVTDGTFQGSIQIAPAAAFKMAEANPSVGTASTPFLKATAAQDDATATLSLAVNEKLTLNTPRFTWQYRATDNGAWAPAAWVTEGEASNTWTTDLQPGHIGQYRCLVNAGDGYNGLHSTTCNVAKGTYAYYDPTDKTTPNKSHEATALDAGSTTWGLTDTWYVCQGDVTIPSRVTVNGTVNLILRDDCHLTASGGIQVQGTDSLTIWAEKADDAAGNRGQLTATVATGNSAAIGGNDVQNGGKITINGGDIQATSNGYGAGIGGGGTGSNAAKTAGHSGDIQIAGGTVSATSDSGAGIGGGGSYSGTYGASGGTVLITGGTVSATSDYGAGIGGGRFGKNMRIKITGGTILEAKGVIMGVGIGLSDGEGSDITIGGNAVIKKAGSTHGGIGFDANGSIIIQEKAQIEAIGDTMYPGIGGHGTSITIQGSPTVKAYSLGSGAGIGGTINSASGPINIFGGTIDAWSAGNGAGIGGGGNSTNGRTGGAIGTINITGGTINAWSAGNGSGIGSGGTVPGGIIGSGGTINIFGGTVNAASKGGGVGIGCYASYFGNPAQITIARSKIVTSCGADAPNIGAATATNFITIEIDASTQCKLAQEKPSVGSAKGSFLTATATTGDSITLSLAVDDKLKLTGAPQFAWQHWNSMDNAWQEAAWVTGAPAYDNGAYTWDAFAAQEQHVGQYRCLVNGAEGYPGLHSTACTVKGKYPAPTLSIDFVHETLTGFAAGVDYQVSVDGGATWYAVDVADGACAIEEGWLGKAWIRQADSEYHADNGAWTLTQTRPGAPDYLGADKASAPTEADGKITGLVAGTAYEYRASGGTYQALTADTGLAVGTYDVRLAATDSAFASPPAQVKVGVVRAIAVSTAGLDNLKVGDSVTGKVVYTLVNGTYADQVAGFTPIDNLPAGLAVGTVTRTDTAVAVEIAGTPTTANAQSAPLRYPAAIAQENVADQDAPICPTGTIAAGPVAKGDGPAVSGAPTANGAPTATSITVHPVTCPDGFTVEYAISTDPSDAPATWQAGPTFGGLRPDTDYYVFARTQESANYLAGPAQASGAIRTGTAPTPPDPDKAQPAVKDADPDTEFVVGAGGMSGTATIQGFAGTGLTAFVYLRDEDGALALRDVDIGVGADGTVAFGFTPDQLAGLEPGLYTVWLGSLGNGDNKPIVETQIGVLIIDDPEQFDLGIDVLAVRRGKTLILPVLKGYAGRWTIEDTDVAQFTKNGTRVKARKLGATKLVYTVDAAPKKALVLGDRVLKAGDSYEIALFVRGKGQLATQVAPSVKKLKLTTLDQPVQVWATVKPAKALDKQLFFTSTDPKVATVDRQGTVTPVGVGSCKIRVVSPSLKRANISVTVTGAIAVKPAKKALKAGKQLTLTATVAKALSDKTITWTSSDEAVATVDDGVVTALKKGKATITATAANGDKATCALTVKK